MPDIEVRKKAVSVEEIFHEGGPAVCRHRKSKGRMDRGEYRKDS